MVKWKVVNSSEHCEFSGGEWRSGKHFCCHPKAEAIKMNQECSIDICPIVAQPAPRSTATL